MEPDIPAMAGIEDPVSRLFTKRGHADDHTRTSRPEVTAMARCDVCGNDYDKAFAITGPLGNGTFDSFECAMHMLAPTCAHCGCRIIGHGAEHDGVFYCCAHCAKHSGVVGIDDRI